MSTRPWPADWSARVAVEGLTAKSVPWANIFWVHHSSVALASTAQCTAFATAFYNAYNSRLFSLLGKDATMQRCVVNAYGTSPNQNVGDYLAVAAGGSGNNTEIDSLSAAISWPFSATWRGGKPRTYLPALPTEAFLDSNSLEPAFITAVESAAADFAGDVAVINVTNFHIPQLGLMSFFSGNAPRAQGVFYPFDAGAKVHPRIDSMRRRLGKERL